MNEMVFFIAFIAFVIVAYSVNRMHARDLVENENEIH
jgi:hypothetical protein